MDLQVADPLRSALPNFFRYRVFFGLGLDREVKININPRSQEKLICAGHLRASFRKPENQVGQDKIFDPQVARPSVRQKIRTKSNWFIATWYIGCMIMIMGCI